MKQKSGLILFVFFAGLIPALAQCSCSGTSSCLLLNNTGENQLLLPGKSWQAESQLEYRIFKMVTDVTSAGTSQHHHSGTSSLAIPPELKNMLAFNLGLKYGLSDHITLSIQQPVLMYHLSGTSTRGLGDALFTASFKITELPRFSAALHAGVKAPTGVKSEYEGESNLVMGSGSFDPLVGTTMIQKAGNSFLKVSAYYKYSTPGYSQVNYGDYFTYSLSYNHVLDDRKLGEEDTLQNSGLKSTLFTGLSGEWMNEQRADKAIIANTGGHIVYLQAGFSLNGRRLYFPVSLSIPVYQQLKGEQSKTALRIKTGLVYTL